MDKLGGKIEDESEAARAVAQAERDLAQAHLVMDLEAICAALHPDYVIIQPGGEIETREEVLASYRRGDRRWELAQVSDLDIHVYGDMAVVIGHWKAQGENQGQEFDYAARFLSVWTRHGERWRNVAYQAVEIEGE